MATLHWRIVILLTWITLFFNVERVYIEGIGSISFVQAIYALTFLATVLPVIPFFLRWSPVALTVLLTLLYGGALALSAAPIFGGLQTYFTLIGGLMLLVTLLLSYRVGQALDEFRDAVEMITFADKDRRLLHLNDVQELVDIEMSRSRRSERPLSVMVFQTDNSSLNTAMHRLVQEVQRSMMQRYVLKMTGNMLLRYLRRTDIIFEDRKPGRLVLIAPEVGETEAAKVGERIARLIHDRLGITVNYSFAAFPQQAITFEGLLNAAEQRLQTEAPVKKEIAERESELITIKDPSSSALGS